MGSDIPSRTQRLNLFVDGYSTRLGYSVNKTDANFVRMKLRVSRESI